MQDIRVWIKHPVTGKAVPRVDYVREQVFGEGRARASVAKELDVEYQVVYAVTKDRDKMLWEERTGLDAEDNRVPREHFTLKHPTTNEEMTQKQYIQARIFGDGLSRSAVMQELCELRGKHIPYGVIDNACTKNQMDSWQRRTGRNAKGRGLTRNVEK